MAFQELSNVRLQLPSSVDLDFNHYTTRSKTVKMFPNNSHATPDCGCLAVGSLQIRSQPPSAGSKRSAASSGRALSSGLRGSEAPRIKRQRGNGEDPCMCCPEQKKRRRRKKEEAEKKEEETKSEGPRLCRGKATSRRTPGVYMVICISAMRPPQKRAPTKLACARIPC